MTQYIADFFNTTTDYLLGRENLASEKKSELDDYLEELRTRPEMKMLFNVTKNASKEDLEKALSECCKSTRVIIVNKGITSDILLQFKL